MRLLRQYGNEVLNKDQQGNTVLDTDANISIGTWMSALTFTVIKIIYDYLCGDGVSIISLTVISILVNIIYGVSYHIPYMVLAFVYNPVQSSITYLTLIIYILCLYLFFWSIESNFNYKCLQNKLSNKKWIYKIKFDDDIDKFVWLCQVSCFKSFVIITLTLFFIIAVIFTTNVFIQILKLGSFNDFQGVQSFVLPLMIGIIYFVGRPFYKKAKKYCNFGTA